LLPYQHQSERPVRTAALYPFFEVGTPIEILERLWTEDGGMTKAEVRRTAEECGIFFTEKGSPKYRMVFEARRVSSTLRHPAWEFSDVAPLSLGRVAPAY